MSTNINDPDLWCDGKHDCLMCGNSWVQACFCCYPNKQTALRSKSKDWLARNQDNVSKWSNISAHCLLF